MCRLLLVSGLVSLVGCGESGPTKEQRILAATTILESERAQADRFYRMLTDCKAERDKALADYDARVDKLGVFGDDGKRLYPLPADVVEECSRKRKAIIAQYDVELADWQKKIDDQAVRIDAARAERDSIEKSAR